MRLSRESVENNKRKYLKGKIIFKENEIGHEMFVILKGEVAIYQEVNEAQKVLMELRPGATFGEMALVDIMPRSASARAKTDCVLLAIKRPSLEEFMKKNGDFAIKLVKVLSSRLREANKTISELLVKDRENIVLTALIKYAELQGLPVHQGAKVEKIKFINWARSEIGLDVNEIHRIIKILTKDNKISAADGSTKEIIVTNQSAS